ncbi:hemolysin family protein [Isoptericola sp. b441]|uniref:Hemolysin family protein n=1 Tax=Actinotalea lenta TaxID=3064654 RepID=A0ABT9DC84_9CELL|nr:MULTISPECIES: hemolysin family protein [unclassified Isoptericola]MDO8108111.1 hemolysin family protein [Isoptericola sp. b441]MDO8120219.1 hemolysin family protein [Isoptericola sp. b490]
MSGPGGWLLAAALVAVLLAAGLSAGEAGLRRIGRHALAELATPTASGRRVARLAADPPVAADAAAAVRVALEAFAAVLLTLGIATFGWRWWQVLLLAAPVALVAALLGVRLAPRRVGRHHPGGAVVASSALLVAAAGVVGLARVSRAAEQEHDLSDEELRDMVDRVSESDSIEDQDRELFRSVLELGDTLTRAVMVPRTEMITLPRGTPVRKALSLFLRSGYSRVPLVGESVDDVLGVLYLKDLVRHRHLVPDSDNAPVDTLARPAVFVPESKPVDELLREMQHGSSHLALVVDEFGGIAGLVTIEDALEEIVGELTDEHDRTPPEVEDLGDGTYRVPARLPVDELGELFDLELEDEDVDTAGGLLAKALGKVPLSGSKAQVGPLLLVADRVEGRRKQLSTLLVSHAPTPGEPTPRGHR